MQVFAWESLGVFHFDAIASPFLRIALMGKLDENNAKAMTAKGFLCGHCFCVRRFTDDDIEAACSIEE